MRCLLFSVCLVLAMATVVSAAPFLVCDPQGGVDSYKLEFTNSSGQLIANPDVAPDATGLYGFKFDLGTLGLIQGNYTVRASGTNMWGTGNWSDVYQFTGGVPGTPQNLREVPQ